MNDTNVGLGMVPHRKGCRCDECEIERLRAKNARYKQWFHDNGPNLAVHGIGGFRFDFSEMVTVRDDEQSETTKDSDLMEPGHIDRLVEEIKTWPEVEEYNGEEPPPAL